LTPTQTQTTTPTPTVTSTETPTPTPTPSGTPTAVSELEYIVYAEDVNDAATYTFSGVSYSGAGLVILAVQGVSDTADRNISSVSISGLGMTQVVRAQGVNISPIRSTVAGLYSYRMTAGTSADIVVTFNGGVSRCAIAIYRLTNNLSDTAYSTGISNPNGIGSSNSITLNQNTGRNHNVAIVSARSTGVVDWTGATENYDFQMGAEVGRASGASSLITTSGTTTIDSFLVNSGNRVLVGATWN
jgi:hypothetical protein